MIKEMLQGDLSGSSGGDTFDFQLSCLRFLGHVGSQPCGLIELPRSAFTLREKCTRLGEASICSKI